MKILEEIKDARTIAIAGHVRPDGDCVGSCLALYHYLRRNLMEEVRIDLYLEEIPNKFTILGNTDLIKHENKEGIQYDLFISLDLSSIDRLGFAQEYFEKALRTINIDHHISNTKFANLNHVEENASSTCEVLFGLFEEGKIDLDIAKALYLGIIHDTGVFKHSNTSEKTMQIAGKLISKGVPFSQMIDETFYLKNYHQNQILGRCLLESILILNGKCIISSINKRMLEFYDSTSADLDGIIDQLRITQGVEVAILIYEADFHEYKVSMRSNNVVDVRKIAAYFGGGGHIKAAGCTMHGTIHDVFNNLTPHIEHQLKMSARHKKIKTNNPCE
jgi:bifunctional oligoribonuclease and PAP phosphatase NrnA